MNGAIEHASSPRSRTRAGVARRGPLAELNPVPQAVYPPSPQSASTSSFIGSASRSSSPSRKRQRHCPPSLNTETRPARTCAASSTASEAAETDEPEAESEELSTEDEDQEVPSTLPQSPAMHRKMIERLRKFHEDKSLTPEAWQLELICCLAARWDAALIAGTGRGKSLLWEIAALLFPDKIFIIVVPLQAIEIDQVSKYFGTTISAIALSQSLMNGRQQQPQDFQPGQPSPTSSKTARRRLRNDLQRGRYQLIFASPEMLLENPDVTALLSEPDFQARIGGLFVDEAHIIEDWGFRVDGPGKSAFRPEFAKIRVVRARVGLNSANRSSWVVATSSLSMPERIDTTSATRFIN
ncbi:hypothetical protein OC834_006950 [Tilletia horrida]|nr:hypothetical protein OC834_006950 [Tilletia horrida]